MVETSMFVYTWWKEKEKYLCTLFSFKQESSLNVNDVKMQREIYLEMFWLRIFSWNWWRILKLIDEIIGVWDE